MLQTVLLIMILGIALVIGGCAATSGMKQQKSDMQASQAIEDEWGIEVIGIHPSAAGYMLDFRFRVLDPEKAASLIHPTVKPYLIDQASGVKVSVPNLPKVGALRQRSSHSREGWTSYILFSNPGQFIKPSSRVTVVIGSLRIEDLVVE